MPERTADATAALGAAAGGGAEACTSAAETSTSTVAGASASAADNIADGNAPHAAVDAAPTPSAVTEASASAAADSAGGTAPHAAADAAPTPSAVAEASALAADNIADGTARPGVPGIVLVHGGGGTAFDEWVRLWTARGYAAIAMDLEGHVPVRGPDGAWMRHERGGPARCGIFDDRERPLEQQWMYHAVSGVSAAYSLLRSLDGVDPDRIGLAGISWGAVTAALTAGLDDRFAFAMCVYGCGYLYDSLGAIGVGWTANKRRWDPAGYVQTAGMPLLWLNGDADSHFSVDVSSRTHQAAGANSSLTVLPGLSHSHRHGWSPRELGVFADGVTGMGEPLHTLVREEGLRHGIRIETDRPIASAEWRYTSEPIRYDPEQRTRCLTDWQQAAIQIEPGAHIVEAAYPEDAIAAYLNVTDSRGLVVSSRLYRLEIPETGDLPDQIV